MSKTVAPFRITVGGFGPEVKREEWFVIQGEKGETKITQAVTGELWAINGDEDQGVCVAFEEEHYDRLLEIVTTAKDRFIKANDPGRKLVNE